MNSTLKSILIIIASFIVFIAAIKFIFWLAPFLIVLALVAYIVYKIKGPSSSARDNNININNEETTKTNDSSPIDGEVIDVDFEDVD